MNTDVLDRWTDFVARDDRVNFEEYLEGQLAVQQVEAVEGALEANDPEAIGAILKATELNSHILLKYGATEV